MAWVFWLVDDDECRVEGGDSVMNESRGVEMKPQEIGIYVVREKEKQCEKKSKLGRSLF